MADSSISYVGDGSTTDYTFPFEYMDADHVDVTLDGVASTAWSLIAQNTLRFTSAPAVGVKVYIFRSTPGTALVVWADGAVILGKHLNNTSKQSRFISEEARDLADYNLSAALDASATAVTKASQASASATAAASSATAAAGSASTASTQASNASSSASSASTSATAASTSATSAAGSASSASTSATAAASSATAAATSASTATTQATNAAASASAAATSAASMSSSVAAAAASASDAASSAMSAASSAASAITAFDNFDDRYLGQKTSDPALDNDGNALVMGAMYFNTVNGKMKVYSGTSWGFAYNDTASSSAITNDSGVSGATVKDALDSLNSAKQAASANLSSWSAIAPGTKQDYSANLAAWSALATSAKQDALGYTPVTNTRQVTGGGLASGGGALSSDQTITVTAASQAEAEAGTLNTVAMTPLRVSQAIAAQSPTPTGATIFNFANYV